ncbi:MAG: membrane dipeptidase, partial [Clostridia bacterium]|nr:membrane dipeptidase [Clostridia bacterium]
RATLSVENGAFLEERIENVEKLARAGVKMLTLTWNGGNALGGSHGQKEGLTVFGREVVQALAEYKILPDVSHLSERAFYEVSEIMRLQGKPFVASHSNAYAICPHTRNLTDTQIRAVADLGGVIGVNFYPPFLGKGSPAEHIAYIIRQGGEDTVAIGSDFDGIGYGYYKNCKKAHAFLERDLKKAGLSLRQIEKVLYKNALRVLGEGEI